MNESLDSSDFSLIVDLTSPEPAAAAALDARG